MSVALQALREAIDSPHVRNTFLAPGEALQRAIQNTQLSRKPSEIVRAQVCAAVAPLVCGHASPTLQIVNLGHQQVGECSDIGHLIEGKTTIHYLFDPAEPGFGCPCQVYGVEDKFLPQCGIIQNRLSRPRIPL